MLLPVVLALLLITALSLAVIALVAVPARREGRELLTERGEEVVVKVRRSTDKVGQATSGIAGATKAGAAKVRSLRQ
ncbi:hypothetical protein [Janibacter massiliensis]|uniref:hypothetical protein n=1 Tax=Janibacter massiliensis TaxID=2058291 RepID=UPI000D0E6EFA|nr:hypothetical protein [Janibacter massiliensis]